jgi:hypothetical protein
VAEEQRRGAGLRPVQWSSMTYSRAASQGAAPRCRTCRPARPGSHRRNRIAARGRGETQTTLAVCVTLVPWTIFRRRAPAIKLSSLRHRTVVADSQHAGELIHVEVAMLDLNPRDYDSRDEEWHANRPTRVRHGGTRPRSRSPLDRPRPRRSRTRSRGPGCVQPQRRPSDTRAAVGCTP